MCFHQVEQGRGNWLSGVGLASWGGPGPGGAYGLSLRRGRLSLGWATYHCPHQPYSHGRCTSLHEARLEINSSATLLNDGTWHHDRCVISEKTRLPAERPQSSPSP